MVDARIYYDYDHHKRLAQWFIREQIGWGLRKRYQVPKDLPPELLALVKKLIAIEGNYWLRYAPPLERRSVGESDWLPPRLVWQNDLDLFGG
jgi:hypothetical protein